MTTTTDTPAGVAGEGDPAGGTPAKPTVDLPADAANWIGLIRDCDRQIKDLEEAKAVARKHLEQMLGDNEVGTLDGRPAVRWTFVPSSRVDITKLSANEPEIAERYRVPTVSRRFTLADPT